MASQKIRNALPIHELHNPTLSVHEPRPTRHIIKPMIIMVMPVYDGWRTMEYGPSVMSVWLSRNDSSNVKCRPRYLKHAMRISAPATTMIQPTINSGLMCMLETCPRRPFFVMDVIVDWGAQDVITMVRISADMNETVVNCRL